MGLGSRRTNRARSSVRLHASSLPSITWDWGWVSGSRSRSCRLAVAASKWTAGRNKVRRSPWSCHYERVALFALDDRRRRRLARRPRRHHDRARIRGRGIRRREGGADRPRRGSDALASIPVVVVTAAGHLSDTARTLSGVEVLHKPFTFEVLLPVVAR